MKLSSNQSRSGIALIIVMVSIFVLAVLAGGFAYTMKVETKLARNSQFDDQLQWLGRSGVEAARLVIASTTDPYDARMQYWAGGPGSPSESNSVIANLQLDNWQIGNGAISFSLDGNPVTVRITDEERKLNINIADEAVLRQAMMLTGTEAADSDVIIHSILDWIDPDDFKHVHGWESRDYESLPRPYFAKNGPLDDLSELLLVNGVTPELYWGPHIEAHPESRITRALNIRSHGRGSLGESFISPVGLVDLFCCLSAGQININTADPIAMQLIPGIDATTAEGIRQLRAGFDGQDGTGDDVPFQNVGELVNVPGISPLVIPSVQAFFAVRSTTFTVSVEAEIGGVKRRFRALIRRNTPRDVPLLFMETE